MARIRTVKPDFWGSPKTAKVSRDARLLFLGLLNQSDDEGRLLASPKAIAGNVFPHDDDVFAKDIADWMTELVQAGFVQLYTIDAIGYCQIFGFSEHQRVSHPTPSKFPPPPSEPPPDLHREDIANDSRIAPEILRPEVEQGTGNREGEDAAGPAATSNLLLAPGRPPALSAEVDDLLAVMVDVYGIRKVDTAVQQLIDDRRRFQWPSDVRKALETILGDPPASATPNVLDDAQRAQMAIAAEGLEKVRAVLNDPDVEQDAEKRRAFLASRRTA